MFPAWLQELSITALILGIACALVVAVNVARRPQKMAVMNIVWPVTALFGTVLTLRGYFRHGLDSTQGAAGGRPAGRRRTQSRSQPLPAIVAKVALHCGAGCMIGDVIAEWLAFAVPVVAIWLGWQSVFSQKMFAVWVLDFIFAFVLGIVFQCLEIAPMPRPPG